MKNSQIHQRALALLLSLALVFSMIQITGISAFAEESSGVTAYYNGSELFKDSNYTLATNYNSDYEYLNTVTRIVIKDSTDTIRGYAFSGCYNLSEITIPDSVTSIGQCAFGGCSLTGITIPDSVTSIDESAFQGCHRLRTITFGEGSQLSSIGESAFRDCSGLTGITIPASVTSIGASAFRDCSGLTGIAIPDRVTSIGESAFYGCFNLQTVTSRAGSQLDSIGDSAFFNCSKLTGIAIPTGVTSIGASAFSGCYSLTGITIPAGVTSISNFTFDRCGSLTGITIPAGVTSIGTFAFSGCSSLTGITIPTGVTSIGMSAFSDCKSLTGITIPTGVASIGDHAFFRCSNLQTVTFGAGSQLDSIEDYAFAGCSSLTGIAIPDSVASIGDDVFFASIAMQSITVGSNNINYFSDGVSLFSRDRTELIAYPAAKTGSCQVPDSVTTIRNGAFAGSKLTDISFGTGSSLTSVGKEAFSGCKYLTVLTLPNSVSTIGESAFSDCKSLKSMTLPKSLTSISPNLFRSCGFLASVTIPKQVTSIAPNNSAFLGCISLQAINVEQGNANYCSSDGVLYTIEDNRALTMILCPQAKTGACTVKTGTTVIGYSAFADCSKLTDIILPDGLANIEDKVFKGCTELTRIDIPESVTSVGWSLFEDCDRINALTVSGNFELSCDNLPFSAAGNMYVVKDAGGADNSPSCSNKFYFTKSADGSTYQFQSYKGTKVGIVIPTELYGKPISPAIKADDLAVTPFTAYSDGTSLYSDSECQSENEIDRSRCSEVTNVVIGSNVAQIDDSVF
jgi:hypothetical protein